MDTFTDEMIAQVGELTDAFTLIDANRAEGNVVPPSNVKSTPVHVQGTPLNVNEMAGHVQTVPNSVINLVSQESEGWKPESVQDYIKRQNEEKMKKVREEIRLGKQPAAAPSNVATMSSSVPMTSAHIVGWLD